MQTLLATSKMLSSTPFCLYIPVQCGSRVGVFNRISATVGGVVWYWQCLCFWCCQYFTAKATKTCRAAKRYWRPLNPKRSLPVLKWTSEREYFLSFRYFFCRIYIFFFSRATDQQYGIRTKKSYLKTARSCMDTPMNMYSSKGHIKRLTGAFFLADIQIMTYTQVHRYLGHASMFLLTLHRTITVCG